MNIRIISLVMVMWILHVSICLGENGKSTSEDNDFVFDIASMWKNRPIMVSTTGQPIRPTIGECTNCHDTNALIREKSLSQISEAKVNQKWSLSMKLDKIDEEMALSSSTSTKISWFYILSLVLKYISTIVMLFLAIFLGYSYWSTPDNVPSTATMNRVNSMEMHDIYSSSPSTTLRKDALPMSFMKSPSVNTTASSTPKSTASTEEAIQRPRPRPIPFTKRFLDDSSTNGSEKSSPESPSDLHLSPMYRMDRRYDVMSDLVLKQAKKIMAKEEFKNDLAFILFVCNIVETKIMKRDNIDKKQLVADTLCKLFEYDEEDIKGLERNIDFLHSNGLIKKDGIIKQMQSYWVKKP